MKLSYLITVKCSKWGRHAEVDNARNILHLANQLWIFCEGQKDPGGWQKLPPTGKQNSNMNSSEIFYYSATFFVLLFTVVIVYAAYQFTLTLRALKNVFGSIESQINIFEKLKANTWASSMGIISSIIKNFRKR